MKKLLLGILILFAFSQTDAAYYIIRGNVQLGTIVGDTLKVPGVVIVDSVIEGKIDSAIHADTANTISGQNFTPDTISVSYIMPKTTKIRFISQTRDTVDFRKMTFQLFDTTSPGGATQVSMFSSTFLDTSTGSINGIYSSVTKKNLSPASNTVRGMWSAISDVGDSITNAAGIDISVAGGKTFVAGVKVALTSIGTNATAYGIYITGADTALYANTGNIVLLSGFLDCDSVITNKIKANTGQNLILSADTVGMSGGLTFSGLKTFWRGGPGIPFQYEIGQGPDGRRVDFDYLQVESTLTVRNAAIESLKTKTYAQAMKIDSLKGRVVIDSLYYKPPHLYVGFGDSNATVNVSGTDTVQITNAGKNLFSVQETSSISMRQDTIFIKENGSYITPICNFSMQSGTTNDTIKIIARRRRGVTIIQVGWPTTMYNIGTVARPIPVGRYFDALLKDDKIWFEVYGNKANSDPAFRSLNLYMRKEY